MTRLLQRLPPILLLLAFSTRAVADDLEAFAAEFWEWRATHQPLAGDDINRIERPAGWLPDWSAETVERRRSDLAALRERWTALDPNRAAEPASSPTPAEAREGGPVGDPPGSELDSPAAVASESPNEAQEPAELAESQEPQEPAEPPEPPEPGIAERVDYRLLGSALARVEWELDVHPAWRLDPWFYVAQTEGAVFELLLQPAPFTPERSAEILARMESIPDTIFEARKNLDLLVRPFAEATIAHLRNARGRLQAVASQLRPELVGVEAERLYQATEAAIAALEGFGRWLEERLPEAETTTTIGAEAYDFFLARVALIPSSRGELISQARQEWERAVAFEALERIRNRDLPELSLFADEEAQIARSTEDEVAVRAFLEDRGLLTVPEWMGHYRNLPMPSYLRPLAALGVTDDLTSESRLGQDGVSYILAPSTELSYFRLSTAKDPRPILVHEGVPGHYTQLVLSWAHENPIRRRYYDSGPNEGIGFYAEEMLLQAGLFDDRPRTREIIYNFMRLRALRVEVDVKLATGELTVDEAADYLEAAVPMDRPTAVAEAVFFAATPGQAISYQVGKLQITRFLNDARQAQGEEFDLRSFHDFVWKNGNVPIALQRWEYLGLDDEIRTLDSEELDALP